MRGKLIDLLALPAMPLLLLQGRRLDRQTLRLLPAYGPPHGSVAGSGTPLRVLAVGESTAVGVGVDSHEEAVASRFSQAVNARTGRAVVWEAAGRCGATVREGHAHVLPRIPHAPRDLVLILFGANDTLARRSAQDFARDLAALIADLRVRVGDASILVSSVPPMETFPALPRPLNTYLGARARWLDQAAAELDLPGVWHAPVNIDMEPVLFAEDGFHPGPIGYQVWGENLAASAFRFGLVREDDN
jgi:lysophospholipase L1-like esterase